MGIFGKPKEKETNKNLENNPNYIKVYDEFGREMFITKDDWRKDVLPYQLKKDWDNPDNLSGDIIGAFQDGFFKDVLNASRRLMEIDENHERGCIVYSIALMNTGQLDAAEQVLVDCGRKYGESGIVATNLAKVYSNKGKNVESENILRHALEIDPNQDNALNWLMAIENERGGRPFVIEMLEKYSSLPGSWRPQLWLGRYLLEKKDIEHAKEHYRICLERSGMPGDVLKQISGDLGVNGYLDEIMEIVAPHYVPEKHGPDCGCNLIFAYIQKKDWKNGLELMHRMRLQNWPPYNALLMGYADTLEKMKVEQEKYAETCASGETTAIVTSVFDKPIWLYSLKDPKWLNVRKQADAVRVVMFPLSAVCVSGEEKPRMRQEDYEGRLSRGIPLLLFERLYFYSDCIPVAYVFAIRAKGPVLFGRELDLKSLSGFPKIDADVCVTGEMFTENDKLSEVKLHLWDVKTMTQIVSFSEKAANKDLSFLLVEILRKLESELAKSFNVKTEGHETYYRFPLPQNIEHYVSGLAQSLTLSLVVNDCSGKEHLFGERNIYEWFVSLSIVEDKSIVPRIMLASGLAKGLSFGSNIPKEFEDKMFGFFDRRKQPPVEFAQLEPLMLKVFGRTRELMERKNEFMRIGQEDYKEWLKDVFP